MNKEFENRLAKLVNHFESLKNQTALPLTGSKFPSQPAIYVFFENSNPVHFGRTRNLTRRLSGHVRKSHNTATFAFKETRRLTKNEKATYKTAGSRSMIFKEPLFSEIFTTQIDRLRKMSIKFLVVEDPIDQYLLELYAALEFGTSLTEFDTH